MWQWIIVLVIVAVCCIVILRHMARGLRSGQCGCYDNKCNGCSIYGQIQNTSRRFDGQIDEGAGKPGS